MITINWIIIISVLIFPLVFFCFALIERKKRAFFISSVLILVFNFYAYFDCINNFRRDFSSDMMLFPLGVWILYFILMNGILETMSIAIFIKFDLFRENSIIQKINGFWEKFMDVIFNTEKLMDKISTSLILLLLLFIMNFIMSLAHEFGHCIGFIINGYYYTEVTFNIFMGGLAYGGGPYPGLSIINNSLTGMLGQLLFGAIILIILFFTKEKKKENNYYILNTFITFIIHGFGYFSIYALLNYGDPAGVASFLNISTQDFFWMVLPFFIGFICVAIWLDWNLYRKYLKPNKFFSLMYVICVLIFYFYLIFPPLFINVNNLIFIRII